MILARLFASPGRFAFFQAVRLLELARRRDSGTTEGLPFAPLGIASDARHEAVRFRGSLSLAFPPAEIEALRGSEKGRPPVMTVSFLGLTGAMGALPPHYAMIAQRMVRARSTALRDFLDVFNHRLIALFYAAWAKYRLPIAYERQGGDGRDGVTQLLRALVGIATPGTAGRLPSVPDEVLLHYAGALSRRTRSAAELGQILSDHIGHPVRVEQFAGRWLALPKDDQTRLSGRPFERGGQCRLGDQALAGSRVWDVENGVRLVVGPLDYAAFGRFLPGQRDMTRLMELARFCLGIAIRVDVQPLLLAQEIPGTRLGTPAGAALGWDSWLDAPGRGGVVGDLVLGGG